MQLFILFLALAVLGHDAWMGQAVDRPVLNGKVIAGLLVAHAVLAVSYAALCRHTLNRLNTVYASGALWWIDTASTVYRHALLLMYVIGLWLGTLGAIRKQLGDQVLLDELLVFAPPLAMIGWSWWSYYPVDHRLRQAPLIRHLDQGQPIGAIWSRGQYMLSQLRHQVALVLVPLVTLMGWAELVHQHVPQRLTSGGGDVRPVVMIAGACGIFVFTPVVIRYLWDTVPLPPGDLRDRLMAMCRQYHVRVRELLLWRTFGGMINGAVMGLFGPVRYILLTDALLERLPRDRVEAVMAHELAHVRQHHMFWLVVAATAAMAASAVAWALAIQITAAAGGTSTGIGPAAGFGQTLANHPDAANLLAAVGALASWITVFGWVSRRFERQADTFAVQHMHTHRGQRVVMSPAGDTIDTWSVNVMATSLQQVADLNHVSVTHRSWRHGSIAWRQAYLRSLLGTRVDRQPIDQQVLWIKLASAATVVAIATTRWICPTWLDTLVF